MFCQLDMSIWNVVEFGGILNEAQEKEKINFSVVNSRKV